MLPRQRLRLKPRPSRLLKWPKKIEEEKERSRELPKSRQNLTKRRPKRKPEKPLSWQPLKRGSNSLRKTL